jgi:hypothetical protein
MSTKIPALSCGGLVLVAAFSVAGCYARARVEPAYVETTYVPARVETYPSYYYEGRTVYLIDGRWYYRQPSGAWVYYRREPPVLYRQRVTIREAPPARARPATPSYHRETPVREAPPAYYRDDNRRVPPPAPPPKKRHHDDRDHDDRDRDGRRHDRDRDHDHDHDHDRDRDKDRH